MKKGIDPKQQREVRFWEIATGKERGRFAFDERTMEPFTIAYSADSKMVAVRSGSSVDFSIR